MSDTLPRFQTITEGAQGSWGAECIAWAQEELGIKLMPWQKSWLEIALTKAESGFPLHDVASILSIPRQSGKTTVVRVLIGWWSVKFPESWSVYVAQTRDVAAKHIMALGDEMVKAGLDVRVYRGVPQYVIFGNGSQIHAAAPNYTSLHGATISGVAVIDEAWTSLSAEILQSVVPARAAAPQSLLVMLSTMGTADSDSWNSFVDRGRDGEEGISYTEYSMDTESQDLFDEEEWWSWMPALGITQTVRSIRAGMQILSPGEARRAYGNIPTSTLHELFDMEIWNPAQDVFQEPRVGDLVLGLSANATLPRGAAVAAAWMRDDEKWHIDIVESRPGGGVVWLLDELEELIRTYKPRAVCIGASSAVYAIKVELEKICQDYAIPFKRLTAMDEKAACSLWSETLRESKLSHAQSHTLDLAVQYAIPKHMDEAGYRLDSKNMKVDSSPLTAAIAALSIGVEEQGTRVVGGIW